MRTNKKFGWIPDLPDTRDLKFLPLPPIFDPTKLPPKVDLRGQCPPVYDQGDLGSCTANGIAGILEFDQVKQKEREETPSRLFIYWGERSIEGTEDSDSGAMIRDGIKYVSYIGVPPESLWPYDISKFADKPDLAAFNEAIKHEALKYERIVMYDNIDNLRYALSLGFPFVFGFSVYNNIYSNEFQKDWTLHAPSQDDALLGGHAVVCVGYDDPNHVVIVRNSWGSNWGINGYFYMDYAYICDTHLCDDFWVISQIS